MVYFNSVGQLHPEALGVEIVLRLCGLIAAVQAYRGGLGTWALLTFISAVPMECIGSNWGGYCKTESFIMLKQCSELTLHAHFWVFWVTPALVAGHRLGLRPWMRPFAVGLYASLPGIPFDLAGPIVGWWHWTKSTSPLAVQPEWINHWLLPQTTVFPGAWAQHWCQGFAAGLLVEAAIRIAGEERRNELGNLVLTWKQQAACIPVMPVVAGIAAFAPYVFPPPGPVIVYLSVMAFSMLTVLWGIFTAEGRQSQKRDAAWCVAPLCHIVFCLASSVRSHVTGMRVPPVRPELDMPLQDFQVVNAIIIMAVFVPVSCVLYFYGLVRVPPARQKKA